jgi:hypothetical protein
LGLGLGMGLPPISRSPWLHAAAAIVHHCVFKACVLRRMLPARGEA